MRVNSAIYLYYSTYFYIDICSIYIDYIDIQKTCFNNMLRFCMTGQHLYIYIHV